MSGLHPTKARLALLQAIDDGAVTMRYPPVGPPWAEWDLGPGNDPRRLRVTARVREAAWAGWARVADPKPGGAWRDPRPAELTDLGLAVLEGSQP